MQFLDSLKMPYILNTKERAKFHHKATKFLLHDGVLYRRASKNEPPKRVVVSVNERREILE